MTYIFIPRHTKLTSEEKVFETIDGRTDNLQWMPESLLYHKLTDVQMNKDWLRCTHPILKFSTEKAI